MIIKGTSRAGPGQLAKHLQRTDTNERVEILELQSPSERLYEAFLDWQVISEGTRGTKGLYHANIDPDADYPMTKEQWQRAVSVLEEELGYQGQPRAVVLHEKHGRTHIHVVWQRTNVDTMTLVSDSWNYRAHERASLRLELEFGHEIVPGKHEKRDRAKQTEFPKAEFTHAEWQQAERAGIDPRERKEAITALHAQSDSGQAFKNALEAEGYILAKGDRRDFVLVDANAVVHSLARQVNGTTAKDLRAFMADIDREALPTVAEARTLQEERKANRQDGEKKTATEGEEKGQTAPAEPSPDEAELRALKAAIAERNAKEYAALTARQLEDMSALRADIQAKHDKHTDRLAEKQKAERDAWQDKFMPRKEGLKGLIDSFRLWLNPDLAATRGDAALSQWHDIVGKQDQARANLLNKQSLERATELEKLEAGHAQERRALAERHKADTDRHLREHEAARELRKQVEEQNRQREQERSRDGPSRAR